MSDTYVRETIENWVSDFCQSDALEDTLRELPREVWGHLPQALIQFLVAACAAGDCAPGELEQEALTQAFLESLAPLALPPALHAKAPDAVAALLGYLEGEGRLGGGRDMGTYLRAMRERYGELAGGRPKPIVNKTSKLGRNDPCPCGSGKKYKKCCLRK